MKRRNFIAALLAVPFAPLLKHVPQRTKWICLSSSHHWFALFRGAENFTEMRMLKYDDMALARARSEARIQQIKANTKAMEAMSRVRDEVFQELMAHHS